MNVQSKLVLCGLAFLLAGCRQENATSDWQSGVVSEVEQRTWAFHAADTSRDAEAVISLLWPEFTLLADGKRSSYSEVAAGSRAFMADVEVFETEWRQLGVVALSRTSAISTFVFWDRITLSSGEVLESWGPNTFVWQKRGDEWRVIHTDADHYPVSE